MTRLALIAVAILAATAPIAPDLVERYYSTGLFPVLQGAATGVSNLASVALLDVLIIAAVTWLIGQVARIVVARKRIGWVAAAFRALANIATAAAVFYLAFLVMWGLNYRRVPMLRKVGFEPGRVTPEAALDLAYNTVEQVNGLYSYAHARETSDVSIDPSLASAFADAQHALGLRRLAQPARPKTSILDLYFKSAGVDGMTDPFMLETLVAADLLPFERPQVIAHEWAHLAGFADEGEANFVGWLTCLRAPNATKYSGWLFLYGEVASSLKPDERADVASRLADGPRADLRAVANRIRQHLRPAVANAGWRVYDRYLKANRVDAGVRSYAEVVRLVLGVRLEER